MGQKAVTPPDMTQALLQAIRRVVPRYVEVSESTPLNRAGIDSLALVEVMVHLERLVGLLFDEAAVQRAMLQPDYDPAMPVEKFGLLLLELAGRSSPEPHTGPGPAPQAFAPLNPGA